MAIRVSSNTPQQQQASAETFGYIRSYRSPLEGVQAADTGRGLQQAGQALQNVASVMKRKEDEAGKLAASNAYESYQARLEAVNDRLKQAYASGNKEEQTQFQAQFDSFNPENKDFTLGTEVDKKYYDPYLGSLAKNWNRHNIAHSNAKNQYKITNDLTGLVDNGTNSVAQFRLQKDIGFNQYGEQIDKIIVAGTKSSVDALSSDRAKNAYRADMSNLTRSVYHEQILRAKSPEDLDAIQQDMLTRLTVSGGLSTFFGETDQRAVETTILSRKNNMFANDSAELKAIAADDLNKTVNNISQISAEIDSLDNPELPIIISNVRELWEGIDSSKLPDSGQRTHKSLGAFISKFNPNVHFNPVTEQEINVGTDFSIDIKAMTKDPNYVIPVDEDLRPEEATKYRTMVENTVNRAKTAFQNGGGTDALKVLLGKDYDPSTAKDAATALGYPTVSFASLPPQDFPNDPLNDEASVKTWFSHFFTNNTADQAMAYGTYAYNQAKDNAQRFQGFLITQLGGEIARGTDVDTLLEKASFLTNLTKVGSASFSEKEEEDYKTFLELAERQPIKYQLPMIREMKLAYSKGDKFMTNNRGTGYLDNLLRGAWLQSYRAPQSGSKLFFTRTQEVYNNTLKLDSEQISVMNGFLSNSSDSEELFGLFSNSGAMDVRLPPSMSEKVLTDRNYVGFGQTLYRAIGQSDLFTTYGEQLSDDPKFKLDEVGRRAAFVGIHWLVNNGDLEYRSLLQQKLANGKPHPLIAHLDSVKDQVNLNELSKDQLFNIFMELEVVDAAGNPRPMFEMIHYGKTDEGEMGSVIGVWNYDENKHTPTYYADNKMAVVPHSHLESYENQFSSATEQGLTILPFYDMGADTSFEILEQIRLGTFVPAAQDTIKEQLNFIGSEPSSLQSVSFRGGPQSKKPLPSKTPDEGKRIKAKRTSLRSSPQLTVE